MNIDPVYAALKPTWRLLWQQLRTFHGYAANRRAEQLVLRFMDRAWKTAQIEALLQRLIDRDSSPRDARQRHSLARANGWGSAGQCPANRHAKTPAAREQVCHVVAASPTASDVASSPPEEAGVICACASVQRPREAIA